MSGAKIGRPITSIDGGVRERRTVRFSEGEWLWMKARAKAAGLGTCEWIRAQALAEMPRPKPKGTA